MNSCYFLIIPRFSPFSFLSYSAMADILIRESVDSLCRDGADMPRPPYIGKACTRPNLEDLSLLGI